MRYPIVLCLILVSLFLLLPVPASAETAPADQENLAPDQWVGKTFLFLAMPANKQKEGYEVYPEKMAKAGLDGDPSVQLPYRDYFAHQVTITDAIRITDTPYDYVIHMKDKKTGEKFVSRTFRGQLDELAYLADREKARKQFVGKVIYAIRPALENIRQDNGQFLDEMPLVSIGTPMKVVDVWDGMQSNQPIWLVVRTNGNKLALPMAYSWTNQPRNMWGNGTPWQDAFSLEDPRTRIGDSPELWKLIQTGNIKLGMSQYEVRLSWGAPEQMEKVNNEGIEETLWTYGTKILHFSGDRLISME